MNLPELADELVEQGWTSASVESDHGQTFVRVTIPAYDGPGLKADEVKITIEEVREETWIVRTTDSDRQLTTSVDHITLALADFRSAQVNPTPMDTIPPKSTDLVPAADWDA